MAGLNRRFVLTAVALPLLFLTMSGLAAATTIFVNTTLGAGGVFSNPVCTLPDAVEAANSGSTVAGCPGGTGDDQIVIGVTGTIFLTAGSLPLSIEDKVLQITTFGDGPVLIDGSAKAGGDGGIMVVQSTSKFLELNNLTFTNGLAEDGGAIFSLSGGDVDIKTCLFLNNTASVTGGGEGGAIFVRSGRMQVTNSTFYGNDALKYTGTAGGAIYVVGGSPCVESGLPGAICAGGPIITTTTLKLTNDTFEHNYAKEGSAVFNNDGIVDVKGTIFADHLEGAGTGIVTPLGNCAGTATPPVTDENYNVSVDDSCGFTAALSYNNETAAEVDLDPLGLQNNGGTSETVALEDGSVALDLIPVANCTQQDGDPLLTDQRLFGRPDPLNPNACDSGAYEFDAVSAYTLNSERVQIARSTTPNGDKINVGMTFTANGDPDCDLGVGGDEDALNSGFGFGLFEGTCASLPFDGLFLDLSPFQVFTVNKQQYGSLFQSSPPNLLQQPGEKVSARLVALPTPEGACGKWTLNLEVSGVNTKDTSSLNLGGGNPFAILISDLSDAEACFDVTNAIVGNQIPPGPAHSVRRGTRRR